MGVCGRLPLLALAAVTGCGRLGFEPGNPASTDGNAGDTTSGDAEVALCPVIDEHFDTTLDSSWSSYSSGGASSPTVANGSLVLDVPTTVASSDLVLLGADVRDAVVTVTARDFTYVYGSQVYFEINAPTRYFVVVALADPSGGSIVARIQSSGGSDDVTLPLPNTPLPALRFRLAVSPVTGGSRVIWSYAPSETAPFVELRREMVTDSFDADDVGAAYQVWTTAVSDPPPIRIDDFQLAHPCM